MSTGLPPQPRSTDSLTSLSADAVCLLSCSSCQAGAKFGVQGSRDGCKELSRSLCDQEVLPVTNVADTASPCLTLLAQHLPRCLPVPASGRAVMGFPSPSGHMC